MTDFIEYELQLPCSKAGEKLAKVIGRILKHTYSAKRLRIEHSKDVLTVKAKVEKQHLNAIRGAVRMTMTAKGLTGDLKRDASSQQSRASGDGDSGTFAEQTVQEEPKLA